VIVSVSELQPKSFWKLRSFLSVSQKIAQESKLSKGNKHTALNARGLLKFYTITAWETIDDLTAFRNSGLHKEAMMKTMHYSKSVKNLRWESDIIPAWKEVYEKLETVPNMINKMK